MNRPLALTQRQVKALCEGARKAGFVLTLEVGGIIVRLVPEEQAAPPSLPPEPEEEEEIHL